MGKQSVGSIHPITWIMLSPPMNGYQGNNEKVVADYKKGNYMMRFILMKSHGF